MQALRKKVLEMEGDARGSEATEDSPGTILRARRAFRPYMTKTMRRRTVEQDIVNLVEKPLGKKERRSGYVYIYYSPSAPGYVKIGVTEGDGTQRRLDDWQLKCKHAVIEYSYRDDDDDEIEVPHVYRVEKLVQLELREHRFEEVQCGSCGQSHNEWFMVSPELAGKVVNKYSEWAKLKPYKAGTLDRVYGLDTEICGNLQVRDLCELIPVPPPSDPEDQDDHEAR
jgi:hypothetical protein